MRLGRSHIRFGTFQRLARLGDSRRMTMLVDHVVRTYYPELAAHEGDARIVALLDRVVARSADLCASWMAAGFCHGVLNTDNMTITGESFDYGPWRFTPEWDPDFTAAYFDHYGLYAFGRQPEAIHWDLAQLAGCLSLVSEGPRLSDILAGWSQRFEEALIQAMIRRLGVAPADNDRKVVAALIRALTGRTSTIDRAFFDWRGGRDPGPDAYPDDAFRELARLLEGRERPRTHAYWSDEAPCSMHIDEVEAIWSAIAEHDDWQAFEDKVRAVRRMGEAMEQDAPGS